MVSKKIEKIHVLATYYHAFDDKNGIWFDEIFDYYFDLQSKKWFETIIIRYADTEEFAGCSKSREITKEIKAVMRHNILKADNVEIIPIPNQSDYCPL